MLLVVDDAVGIRLADVKPGGVVPLTVGRVLARLQFEILNDVGVPAYKPKYHGDLQVPRRWLGNERQGDAKRR